MKKALISAVAMLCMATCFSQTTIVNAQTDRKLLKTFQNAKLGLFLHYLACYTPETGDSWSIGRGTPKSVSDSITLAWNPEKFDPKEVVDFAIKAGCKYIVVVSKHHDGFGIWNSRFTDFDLQQLKFKRDIIGELEKEAHAKGLLFGIYYSIADMHYTGWDTMPDAQHDPPKPIRGKDSMVTFVHNQVQELLQHYRPDIIWFDGFWLRKYWTLQDGRNLFSFMKKIQPRLLSTRLASTYDSHRRDSFYVDGASGDFFSCEAKTKDTMSVPWEACTSISYPTYGFDPRAKLLSKQALISTFDKVVCGNGNLLLNIGPDREGALPELLTNRFMEMSEWIKKNKAAIYNTSGGPFKQGDSMGSTYTRNKIYLHIRKKSLKVRLPDLIGYKILGAKELVSGKKLAVRRISGNYEIEPGTADDQNLIQIIELTLNKDYTFSNWLPLL